LTAELLGNHPSIAELAAVVRDRAAGNPFFAEEIVRDLTERGVIDGQLGAYALRTNLVEANVPATLSATIGARIDRLDAAAKETLNAAAVIGLRFDQELLSQLIDRSDLASLINAELITQVAYHPRPEYAFRHPLIRAVAYESQLKSARAQRHRALAATLESHGSLDESAALIAEHIEAAGDLPCAYEWHMRAGEWSTHRNIDAARTSWTRAQRVADLLPDDHPNRMSMRIAPRTFLAGTAWRIRGGLGDPHFEELRELCMAVGDRHSLAIGWAGSVTHHIMNARRQEASRLASELVDLIDSIGDPALDYGVSIAPIAAKHECGEVVEMLRLSQRVIDLSRTTPDPGTVVFESPLSFAFASRGTARCSLGIPGWRADLDTAARMLATTVDPMALASMTWWVFGTVTSYGIRIPDAAALRVTAENLALAERSGDDYALDTARLTRAVTLLHTDRPDRDIGLELLEAIRDKARGEVLTWTTGPIAEIHIARELTRRGSLDAAIDLARSVSTELLGTGGCIWTWLAVEVLVDATVARGSPADIEEARIAVDRLSEVPTDAGFVLSEVTLARARALLAWVRNDVDDYRRLAASYRELVTDLGFEGHMARAATLPTNQ
jgi:adenylate cyclase